MAAVTGTGSMSIPLPISPGRGGMQPSIALAYDSGAGNGPFGIGWTLSVPSIRRKTEKGLPQYFDAADSDVFILSGAEDLVPFLKLEGGSWNRVVLTRNGMKIERFRPRVEGLFARIERRTVIATGEVFWVTTSKDNVTSLYGAKPEARIADPDDPTRVFEWLLQATYDDRGNAVLYEYKQEDRANAPLEPFEAHRTAQIAGAQRYLKRVYYGNQSPLVVTDPTPDTIATITGASWHFEVVFDYGEHHATAPKPTEEPGQTWPCRQDPFSTYKARFELRTYRLCRRVLMFHGFAELGADPLLVASTDFTYSEGTNLTYLAEVTQRGYLADGTSKALPPLTLDYQLPVLDDTVRSVDPETVRHLPGAIDGRTHRWVDLDGEGIAGLLSDEGGALYYRRNLGGAGLSTPRLLPKRPSTTSLASGQQQLMDLDSDGQLELVDFAGPVKGFYSRTADDDWMPFVAFKALPVLDWNDPNLQFLDLNGDGFADVLRTEGDRLVWYPSKGKDGFAAGIVIPIARDERKAPAVVFADPEQVIHVADMSGDGLADIVRVRNGEIAYWPNLGYGKFGAKVTMGNSPRFDRPDLFDPKRVRLFDIDGSGTNDVAYLGAGGVALWFNHAGNQWSAARPLLQYLPTHDLASLTFADFLGTGTGCLVWFSTAPGDRATRLRYVDILGSKKPHVLIGTDNNMGLTSKIAYTSSTKLYLEDRANGVEWATRLAFPVQVVERVETYEAVTKTRLVTRYRYRHGYYDGPEREFRGFGLVEQWDAESYGKDQGVGLFPTGLNEQDGEFLVPPVYTKTWFHTGAWKALADIAAHFQGEYYAGDSVATVLPRTAFVDFTFDSAQEEREAARALKGSILRQEVYAIDGTPSAGDPFSVSERSYQVRRLQPVSGTRYAVYLAHAREVIDYHYERNPADPRVQHAFTLDVDDYGTVLKAAAVGYPRRSVPTAPPLLTEQSKLLATVSTTQVVHDDATDTRYRIGIPIEAASYELTGLSYTSGVLSFDAVETAAATNDVLAYEQAPTTGFERRLLKKQQVLYYTDNLSGALALGSVGTKALVYRTQSLALTGGLVTSTYGSKVTGSMLTTEGGYLLIGSDYWVPSGVSTYDSAHFYLVTGFTEPFGNESSVTYDSYSLLPIRSDSSVTTTALNLVTTFTNDYRVLQPSQVTDPNDNRTAVAFDALGMVTAMAVMGKSGAGEGDTLASPTAEFTYDLWSWRNTKDDPKPTPVYSKSRLREQHGNPSTPWQESYGYTDGHGREVMRKVQAEPGLAPKRDANGDLVFVGEVLQFEATSTRWVGTGRTVVDNKGNPIKQYEPFFDTGPEYTDETELAHWGVTPVMRYDALGRLIRTDAPNGTFTSVVFDPWKQASYDANDNVLGSRWYQDRSGLPVGNPERRAANLAAAHASTPTLTHQDTLGRTFLTQADNGTAGKYDTRVAFDIEGNTLSVTDARGNATLTHTYAPGGKAIRTVSAEAGESLALYSIEGGSIRAWNDRNIAVRREFDGLRRPTHLYVTDGANPEFVAERTVYGEGLTDSKARNARGQVYRTYDGAGVVTNAQRDFKGNLTELRRKLALAYQTTPTWSSIASLTDIATIESTAASLLEPEEFTTTSAFDALNRVTSMTAPDASQVLPTYNEANLLEKVDVKVRGAGTATPFVKNIDYDAKGQRTLIEYSGGDFSTTYAYDPLTLRLTTQSTTRSVDSADLQNFTLTYDPVGNIVELSDAADRTLYFSGVSNPVSGGGRYEYDAIYRLVSAEGREHPGQVMPDQNDSPLATVPHPNDTQAMRAYAETYQYDQVGNILKMIHSAGLGSWTRTYEYASTNNRLSKTSLPGDPDNGPYTGIYAHDARGNMTQMPHLSTIAWDWADRMQTADLGGGGDVYFTYDSAGQRVRKVWEKTASLKDERIYLGGYEIFRSSLSGVVQTERQTLHVMDDKRRIAMVETLTVSGGAPVGSPVPLMRFQIGNHLDSASVELTETGGVISYEEYFPFGATSFRSADGALGVSAKRYRYTGKERDEETGLCYYGARYYAAWLGRWTAADPLTIRGRDSGINTYAYVKARVIRATDPDGRTDTDVNDARNATPPVVAAGVAIPLVVPGPAPVVASGGGIASGAAGGGAVAGALGGIAIFGIFLLGGYVVARVFGPDKAPPTHPVAPAPSVQRAPEAPPVTSDETPSTPALPPTTEQYPATPAPLPPLLPGKTATPEAMPAPDVTPQATRTDVVPTGRQSEAPAGPIVDLAKNDETKFVPNPYGKLGGPAHQAEVQRVAKDIEERRLVPDFEHRVDTPEGTKQRRYVDVIARDPATGKIIEYHQVGRQTVSGQPVARERRAIEDLQIQLNTPIRFHPYNNSRGSQ